MKASSPAATELETITMNWLGKMIGLPDSFLHSKNGRGGGVIQTTASEATLGLCCVDINLWLLDYILLPIY